MHAVTFNDSYGKYFWYLITFRVEPPKPVKVF